MKLVKIIAFVSIIMIIISSCTMVFADINPMDYKTTPTISGNGEVMTKAKTIISVINLIGIIVLFITVAILGVKYIAGSVEQRAEYKKDMMPIFIGAVLLFALSTIINIIYSIVTK